MKHHFCIMQTNISATVTLSVDNWQKLTSYIRLAVCSNVVKNLVLVTKDVVVNVVLLG